MSAPAFAFQKKRVAESPEGWARARQSLGLQRFGEYGTEFDRIANAVFPRVPSEAFMGFALNGTERENTTEGVPKQAFHELGMFGTRGGPRNSPAPAPGSDYAVIGNSQEVQTLLGRRANVAPGAWRPPARPWTSVPEAVRDQIAIGIFDLYRQGQDVFGTPRAARLRGSDPNSLWTVATAFMSWSAGPGRTREHIGHFAAQLGSVPENQRWGRFLALLAEAGRRGTLPAAGGSKHRSPYYSALRTMQKLEAARLLAAARQHSTGWFDEGLGIQRPAIFAEITRFANEGVGAPPRGFAFEAAISPGRAQVSCPVLNSPKRCNPSDCRARAHPSGLSATRFF